jgi:ribonucleotide reductase alpha subunit
MGLSDNALAVLSRRYLRRDGERVVETPDEMFARVARHVAAARRARTARATPTSAGPPTGSPSGWPRSTSYPTRRR